MKQLWLIAFVLIALHVHPQVYLVDEQFTSAPAAPTGWTFTGAGYANYSSVSNYGRNANSLQFNATGQQIKYGPWTGAADHISFFHKGVGGAGSTFLVEESSNGTTWTTVGTATGITTAATYDAGLLSTSRYIRLTFTKSGSGNTAVDDLRIRAQTNSCGTPIHLLEIMINGGCGSATCEGANEFVYFETGGNSLDIHYLELVSQTVSAGGCAYGGNGSSDNTNSNWVLSAAYTAAQNTYISNLNTTAACAGTVFVKAPASNIIPANTRVIAFTGAAPDVNWYNFSGLCSLGTVYILFCDQTNCGGKYTNGSCASNCQRYLTLFNHLTGCFDNEAYTAKAGSTAAGEGYIFVAPSVGYTTSASCTSFIILSLDYLEFRATETSNGIVLDWTTDNENNTGDFIVEKSGNGIDFIGIGSVPSYNRPSGGKYAFSDAELLNGIAYYRIRNQDINSQVYYSSVLAVSTDQANSFSVMQNNGSLAIVIPQRVKCGKLEIMNVNGQLVRTVNISGNGSDFLINLNELEKGFYFVRLISNSSSKTKKVFVE